MTKQEFKNLIQHETGFDLDQPELCFSNEPSIETYNIQQLKAYQHGLRDKRRLYELTLLRIYDSIPDEE